MRKDNIERNQALIRGLINPGECYRWEGEWSPRALLLFVKDKPRSHSVSKDKPLSYSVGID